MNAKLFLQNKIERQLKQNGTEFEFEVFVKDDFNQKIKSEDKVKIVGIFHETTSYLSKKIGEGYNKSKEPSPMILTNEENAKKLEVGYELEYNEQKYKISNIHNISGFEVAFDISLEVIQ